MGLASACPSLPSCSNQKRTIQFATELKYNVRLQTQKKAQGLSKTYKKISKFFHASVKDG